MKKVAQGSKSNDIDPYIYRSESYLYMIIRIFLY